MTVRLFLMFCLLELTACSSLPGVQWLSQFSALSPFKIDIRQGNSLDPKQIDKLKLGMTRAQVQFIMGTSLLIDPFRPDRWDYVYSLQHDGKTVEFHKLELYFEQDKLSRIVNDFGKTPIITAKPSASVVSAPSSTVPDAASPVVPASVVTTPATVTPLPATVTMPPAKIEVK